MNLSHEDRLLIKKIRRTHQEDFEDQDTELFYCSSSFYDNATACIDPMFKGATLGTVMKEAFSLLPNRYECLYLILSGWRNRIGPPYIRLFHKDLESFGITLHDAECNEVIFLAARRDTDGHYDIGVPESGGKMFADFERGCTDHHSCLNHITQILFDMAELLIFMKTADIEYKTAKGELVGKTKDWKQSVPIDERALFLDASFYTTIIRSEGFGVRGHFRLQPYKKDGEWTKKLIWIKPFNKQGYTRTAKKNIS